MSNKTTQLSSPDTYDVNKMIFAKAIKSVAKPAAEGPEIKTSRILISTQNDDGTVGELIFPTTELFSFGVSVNIAMDGTGKVSGHSLPICMWNRAGPTPEEKALSTKLEEVVEKCKDYILLESTMEDVEKYDLDRSQLKKLNSFIYWKKEKGKVVAGTGPTMYPKLIESKKTGKIITTFFDASGNLVDPMSLIGKNCYVKAAIKIESIFVGVNFNIQVKVYETEVRLVENGFKSLLNPGLKRPFAETKVQTNEDITHDAPIDDEAPADVIHDDDDDQQSVEASQPPAPVVEVEAPARKQIRTVKPKK